MTYDCPACGVKLKAIHRVPSTGTEYVLYCGNGRCTCYEMNEGAVSTVSFEDAHDKLKNTQADCCGYKPEDDDD